MPTLKARISLSAFRHNLKVVEKIVGKNVAQLPIIKADGYGHGVVPLAKEALKFGVPILGVGRLSEGVALRRVRIGSPILLVDGVYKEEIPEVIKRKLTPVVFSVEILNEINRVAKKIGKKATLHLKFDTGMSRLGFSFAKSGDVFARLKKLKNIEVEGIMTHLASSSDRESPQTELQIKRFSKILSVAKAYAINPKWIHTANSGGIINFPSSHFNMVRPGIMLYGLPPSHLRGHKLKPVMTVYTRLISVKDVKGGEGVGYNATYVTPRAKRIGVVMGGYADGINRLLSNSGVVLFGDKLLPIIGNICMDSFMVDLSRAVDAKAGDEVILMSGANEKVSAGRWAELLNTIPYEVVCTLGRACDKFYK